MRTLGLLVSAAAAIVVLLAIATPSSGETYWVAGLPAGGAINANQISPTGVAVTNVGTASDLVTLTKEAAAGVGASTTALPVSPGTTGLFTFTDWQYGTQISNVGIYRVDSAEQPLEVRQLASAGNSVGGLAGGSGSDATRVLEESRLGATYTVLTNANPRVVNAYSGNSAGFYIPPNRDYFTVIAIKDGTQVTITFADYTASDGVPGGIPAMSPGQTASFMLDRGWALHVEGTSLGSPDCPATFAQWWIGLSGYPACDQSDLTGTKIVATTSVAVYAGADCWTKNEPYCDVINQQMLPDTAVGKTYVYCSGVMTDPHVSDLEVLRIANPNPSDVVVDFARPVSSTSPPSTSFATTSITIPAGAWTEVWANDNNVITSSERIQLVAFIDKWITVRPPPGSTYSDTMAAIYGWGGASMVSFTPMDSVNSGEHWLYSFPGFDNHVIIGGKMGLAVTDSIDGGAPTSITNTMNPIFGTEYGCMDFVDLTPTGATHRIVTSGGAMVQMVGLGQATGYWYDAGSKPIPVAAPTALFKPTSPDSGCGPRAIQFTDQSQEGSSAIVSYQWDFGDGSTSGGMNPTHTYGAPGKYVVTETVTDANGFAAVYTVVVTATDGGACPVPGKGQDDGMTPRPPRDSVDGEIAEGDYEPDGVPNFYDNCVYVANPGQEDADADGVGDACDLDDDNDGIVDLDDNCRVRVNTSQANLDLDEEGDACDDDVDGDTIPNLSDNCSLVANTAQDDADADKRGDACDEALAQVIGRQGGTPEARGAAGAAPQPGIEVPWALVGLGGVVLAALVVALALLRRRP